MKTIFKKGDRVFVYPFGWGEYDKPSRTENKFHYIIFEGVQRAIHNDLISFTEYTLEGFSQIRPVTFEKGEWVAASDGGSHWYVVKYIEGDLCEDPDGGEDPWKHIKKLTDFNK